MGVTILRPGQRLLAPGMQIMQPRVAVSFVGILDGISNIAAAYSLRRLRTAYTGFACKVRRSSDNAEQDIGFDGSGEFDSASFSSFVGGGSGFVKTWYDQSGNSKNATQATTTKQPQIILSGINEKPSVSFNGTNGELVLAASLLSASYSIFSSIRPLTLRTSGDLDHCIFSQYDSVITGRFLFEIHYTGTASRIDAFNGGGAGHNNGTTNISTVANYLASMTNAARVVKGYLNGGVEFEAYFLSDAPSVTPRIGSGDGTFGFFNFLCADLIVVSAALATTDHNTIGNSMATRYGLSWTTV